MSGDEQDHDAIRRGADWNDQDSDDTKNDSDAPTLKRDRHMRPGDDDLDDLTWKPARKKPVEVEFVDPDERTVIHTREGRVIANDGDYVIRGVDGEIYPISAEIFHRTYDDLSACADRDTDDIQE
jgi:hypothetical protein